MKKRYLLAFLVAGFMFTQASAQQLKTPTPSPLTTIKQEFALSSIEVNYSRPNANGRKIYGGLVPYGNVWRTGANASTVVTFSEDVSVNGKALKAGKYSVYSVPGEKVWKVMFNSDLTLGGNVANYKKETEVLAVEVAPEKTADYAASFTIQFADVKATSTIMEIVWENTKVPLKITADIDSKIMNSIDAAMNKDTKPYFQAASYYYENDKDLGKALEWVNKAIAQNQNAFWMYALKAKIQQKSKDFKGATATATQVIELAKKAQNQDYVKIGTDLLNASKGK